MISDTDASTSTLHMLVWQALKTYTVEALLCLLDDDDPIVRTAVGRELHIRGGKQVLDAMLVRCDDARAVAREMAAFTLGQLGTPSFPFRLESIPTLIRLARSDPSSDVRAAAVAALGHLHAMEGKEALLAAARDASADVRANAAVSLGRLGGLPDVVQALEALSLDESSEVQEWAELGIDLAGESAIKGPR